MLYTICRPLNSNRNNIISNITLNMYEYTYIMRIIYIYSTFYVIFDRNNNNINDF